MIKRLLGAAWTMIVYACVGTIISQVVILAYLSSAWKIDNQRWLSVIAAAQGIQSAESADKQTKVAEEKVAEQPSLDQILETRALKYRNLELREQELRNTLSQLQLEQTKLAEDKKSFKQLRDEFDTQLSSMREGAVASGKDEVRNTLENLKPKQAKALILEMLNKKEIDDVVALLSPMPDAKRAKILGEFKTDEEMEQLSEVLRRIRVGSPTASVPENTRKQLEQLKTTQL
jgi:flagellar motility protein MotE (MotC chaperone)